MSAATPPIPGSGPCPICHETGGFHGRTVHPVEVPAHLLKSGDRLDRYRFTDELYAAAHELLMWGNVYYDQDGKVLRSQNVPVQCRGILAGLAEDGTGLAPTFTPP